jgi:protein-S-isoprenylcysteine O-methyltransferase Ste14
LNFSIVIILYFVLMYVFHVLISRVLHLSKRKIFNHEIVNETHKQLDKVIRLITVMVLITGFILSVFTDIDLDRWYTQPYFILVVSLITGQLLKVFMEWKYNEDRREYTYTIFETSFNIILLILFFTVGVQYLNSSF